MPVQKQNKTKRYEAMNQKPEKEENFQEKDEEVMEEGQQNSKHFGSENKCAVFLSRKQEEGHSLSEKRMFYTRKVLLISPFFLSLGFSICMYLCIYCPFSDITSQFQLLPISHDGCICTPTYTPHLI